MVSTPPAGRKLPQANKLTQKGGANASSTSWLIKEEEPPGQISPDGVLILRMRTEEFP